MIFISLRMRSVAVQHIIFSFVDKRRISSIMICMSDLRHGVSRILFSCEGVQVLKDCKERSFGHWYAETACVLSGNTTRSLLSQVTL
jgi:hypothetical protein